MPCTDWGQCQKTAPDTETDTHGGKSLIETLLTGLLVLHIAAGTVSLVAGIVAIATKKGGRRHKQAGRVFVASMGIVVITAAPLALADWNLFLFGITVFSGYLVFNGYRVLARKRLGPGAAGRIDWAGHLTMVVFSVAMTSAGIWTLIDGFELAPVLLAFGVIGGILAGRELNEIRRPSSDRMAWLYRHIGFMGGAFIATVTASITVNLTMLPPIIQWLGPTLVGVPMIIHTTNRYRKKFNKMQTQANKEPTTTEK